MARAPELGEHTELVLAALGIGLGRHSRTQGQRRHPVSAEAGSVDAEMEVGSVDVEMEVGSVDVEMEVGSVDVEMEVGSVDAETEVGSVDAEMDYSSPPYDQWDFAQPYVQWDHARRHCPVIEEPGFSFTDEPALPRFTITSWADADQVLRDWRTFSASINAEIMRPYMGS